MKLRAEDFTNFLNRLYPNKTIKHITLQITEDCNLCCSYCYQGAKTKNKMSFDLVKVFFDALLNDQYSGFTANDIDGVVIDFIGGEPLLEIDLIEKTMDYFINKMIELNHPWLYYCKFSICSNGVLYFEEKIQEFLKKYRHYISLAITVDGDKILHDTCRVFADGTGSYDIASKAANDWKEKTGQDNTKITIAPENIKHISRATINLINMGYDTINMNCVFENVWSPELAKQFYYELKNLADYLIDNNLPEKQYVSIFHEGMFTALSPENNHNWCGGTGSMLALDYKGNFYPCLRYMETSLGTDQPPLIIGNVWDGIASKQHEKDCLDCLKTITRRSQSTDECFNCPIGAGCAWCSGYNYQVFGTPNKRATFICIMHKARALANVYYWNKWYKKTGQNKLFVNHVPDEWALEIIDQDELNMLKELAQ